ncbi:major facilitator superfamily domain-containing protein [Zychaea mexicana]|uniref:major facilitator superfamily domain-containing protein n=1 Tax=Zychaea mexicana TaxID=64656 RepID=UPI0022FF45E8|nr:major facilitator superfamily domain-containing protein [Zychaea mexicana]KAI9490458.1 major facilitator superfamily domain-containing protein [Zychaea mexicana]
MDDRDTADEHTRFLPNNDCDEENNSGATNKQESWSDLKPYIRPLLAANFISVVCGLNDGSIGAIIPRLKDFYGIPNETVSLLFLCNSFGYFLAAMVNGYLVHKLGQLGAMYFGAINLLIAYSLIATGFPFGIMAILMVLQGSGVALLDAGMNVYTSSVPKATLMLNVLHALYGVGAMLSPLINAALLKRGVSWQGLYVALAIFSTLNLLFITFGFRNVKVDLVDDEEDEEQQNNPARHKEIMRAAMRHPMTTLGALYILVYVGTEVTVGGWGLTFLQQGRHGDYVAMSNVIAGYWAALAVGRIILGYLCERFGEKRMITIFTLMTVAVLAVIWVVADIVVDSIAIISAGFLLGPMFPSTISLASKVLPKSMHATSIGFMAGTGAGGAALFPFITGQIAGRFGILSMPAVCLAMAVVMQILWTFVPSDKGSTTAPASTNNRNGYQAVQN